MKKSKLEFKHFKDELEFKEFIKKTYQYVEQEFSKNSNSQSHSLEHTIRVTNTALDIASHLGACIDVLLIAALFHDLGRPEEEKTGKSHAEISAILAQDYLEKNGRREMKTEVSDAIRSHRFSSKITPKFKEGKILKDSDALDALGTIGLYRVISYSIETDVDIRKMKQHFHDKLLQLSSLMHFRLTKRMAKRQSRILRRFVRGLDRDITRSDFQLLSQRLENKLAKKQNFK